MNRWEKPKCSIPDCGRSAASGHLWCHAHVIVHSVNVRGGWISIEEARNMVRRGARANDFMADEADWIAR